jgi:hypothetical protein
MTALLAQGVVDGAKGDVQRRGPQASVAGVMASGVSGSRE